MIAAELLQRASGQGVAIQLADGRLHLRAAKAPQQALIVEIKENRDAIIAYLSEQERHGPDVDWRTIYEEKLAKARMDGAIDADGAAARAYSCVEMEWVNRNPAASAAGRCAGCSGHDAPNRPLIPFVGINPHLTWLHASCWSAWFRERRRKAQTALANADIARPW